MPDRRGAPGKQAEAESGQGRNQGGQTPKEQISRVLILQSKRGPRMRMRNRPFERIEEMAEKAASRNWGAG
jgi:hypothetical protein